MPERRGVAKRCRLGCVAMDGVILVGVGAANLSTMLIESGAILKKADFCGGLANNMAKRSAQAILSTPAYPMEARLRRLSPSFDWMQTIGVRCRF
jgi:hypothetical protein